MIIQRYFEEECLTSLPGERPHVIYVLLRVYKTWETKKKGLKREKWEQKLMVVSGRTPMEAARKLKDKIERKEILPFWRVLKLGGATTPEGYSDHAMTGKELPRVGIAGHGGIPHINDGVLDVGMPQPVLDEGDIRAGVQQMHRNRVAQRMKTPLGFRNGRALAVLLHQVPIRPAFQGDATHGDKQVRGVIIACTQVRPNEPYVFRLHRIGFGDGAFDPRDVDPALLLVDIVTLEQRHFGGPQPVMIGQLKERAVALAGDDRQQPAHLVLGQEGDVGWWRGVLAGLHESDSIPVLSDLPQ